MSSIVGPVGTVGTVGIVGPSTVGASGPPELAMRAAMTVPAKPISATTITTLFGSAKTHHPKVKAQPLTLLGEMLYGLLGGVK